MPHTTKFAKQFRRSMIAVLVSSLCVGLAQAEVNGDVLSLTVAQDYMHDSNVFRLQDDAKPSGYDHRSDSIWTTRGTVAADKEFGRQRLTASLGASKASYTDFSHLNHISTAVQAGWRAGFGAGSEAGLSYNRNESLGNFEDRTGATKRNMVTSESLAADLSLRVAGDWLGVASVALGSYENSRKSLQSGNSEVLSYDAGVRYAPRNGNYVDLRVRESDYDYNRDDASRPNYAYKQKELSLKARWEPNGVSSIEPGVALVRSHHDELEHLDFTGITWFLKYGWKPTAALSTSLRASRDVGAVGDAWGSYAKTYGLSSYTRWQSTAKLGVYLDASWKKQDFEGYQNLAQQDQGERSDKLWALKLGTDFLVTEKLQLGLSGKLARRMSSVASYSYGDKQLMLSAQYRF